MVFVFGSGWRLGAGFVNPVCPGWGLGWVFLGSICGVVPLVSAICGVRGWASVPVCFWDVCGFVGAPLAPRCFRFRRAVWACVPGPGLACAQSVLAGLLGCVFFFFLLWFFLFFLFFFFFFFWALWSLSLHPLSFGLGWWLSFFFFFFFFFFFPFSPWSAVTGLVLPVLGGWFACASAGVPLFFFFFLGGGPGRLWWCSRVVGRLWAVFVPFPLPPSFFFFGGGLACSSLCLPWAGARTGLYSVLSSGLLFSVAFCVAMFRPHGSGGLCTLWARRPFLLG